MRYAPAVMLVAAAALGLLALAGLVTPWVLLALVFAVGTGQALTSPASPPGTSKGTTRSAA